MTGPDPDVLVVGGGPAGSTAANLLARRGWRVLVADRARFPRAKACGECVNPGAVGALRRLGLLDTVLDLAPSRLEGWRIRTDEADVAGDFGHGDHGLGLSRAVLDHGLLAAARDAGASVLEEARVEHVTPAVPGGPRPAVILRVAGERRTLVPRLVIGADGLRSVVSRSLGLLARRPRRRRVSVTVHVAGSGLPDDRGVLDLRDGRTLGVAPVGPHIWNVTLVVDPRRDGHHLAGDATALVTSLLRARFPEAVWTLRDGPWASGPFDWPTRRCWAPGVLLVGDAAGYFDPFTGQGIYRALRSAELAAEAAHASLVAGGQPAPLAAYHRRWTREVRWSRLVQRGVDRVMAHASLSSPLLHRLGATGGLGQVIRVTGDAASPLSLLRPSVWA
jgi:flavin-dependent dehydrogenase